jgi:hypothetical protein
MSEPSVPRQRPPQGNQPIAGDRPPSDPAWLRPTLMFSAGAAHWHPDHRGQQASAEHRMATGEERRRHDRQP